MQNTVYALAQCLSVCSSQSSDCAFHASFKSKRLNILTQLILDSFITEQGSYNSADRLTVSDATYFVFEASFPTIFINRITC